jgi:hypothetical protein
MEEYMTTERYFKSILTDWTVTYRRRLAFSTNPKDIKTWEGHKTYFMKLEHA